MTPAEFSTATIGSIASSTVVVSALGWLFRNAISHRLKSAIQHEYNEKFESYKFKLRYESEIELERLKNKLKSESEISIEQLKSQLQIAAAERNIQYSTVFEKTAEVISNTSEKLQIFFEAVAHYTHIVNNPDGPERTERRIKVGDSYSAFLSYYRPKRMFLPKETASRIDELHKKLHSKAFDFMWYVDNGREKYLKDDRDVWTETSDFINTEALALQELLEDDFRKILGLIRNDT